MNGQELYEEGKQLLARALENTPFTHIHSEDIRLDVLNQYYIPSAKFGYVPAKMDIYYYHLSRDDSNECIYCIKQHKKNNTM